VRDTFEFRTTRNGPKVVTKDMVDYSALMRHLNASKIPYYTFHPKSLNLVKAVIRQLPRDTPTEDIFNELVVLGYSVISIRQMTATQPQTKGSLQTYIIPLFLVTLTRNENALEIFSDHPRPYHHQG